MSQQGVPGRVGEGPENAVDHFRRTLGNVPEPIAVLAAQAPEVLEAYVDFRSYVVADHEGGLDLATKELLFVILDVVYHNEPGALNHLRAGLRAGLTRQALLEALLQTFMVGGIHTWGTIGHRVLAEAVKHEQGIED